MIRGNLATRPFYNERIVHAGLAAITVLALLFTAYNVAQMLHFSRSDADLRAQAQADEARAAELRSSAGAQQEGADVRESRLTSAAALEANQLIARRTFSWTALFNEFEAALPRDVRITAVRPAVQASARRAILVSVVARSVEAVDTFMQSLEETGAFNNALSRDEHVNEQGEIEARIEVEYAPRSAEAGR